MKYDMDNGMWYGLIKDGVLHQVTWSKTEPDIFSFNCSFTISTDHDYEIIPVKIIPETY